MTKKSQKTWVIKERLGKKRLYVVQQQQRTTNLLGSSILGAFPLNITALICLATIGRPLRVIMPLFSC